MIPVDGLSDLTVRAIVVAVNAGDRDAFLAGFADDVTMTDDGSERDFTSWIDREIFTVNGRMEVESQSVDGRSLTARFRNDTWGEMRTTWEFTVADGLVTHVATGQA